MTKITEASNLGALGVPDELVRKIHKRYKLPHDAEFQELKTKSQMQALLKDGRLIIGVSPEGNIASLGKNAGWDASSRVSLIVDGEERTANSMKDALAQVPGRGWKWFASNHGSHGQTRPWRSKYGMEQEATREADDEAILDMLHALDRIYAKPLKTSAEKYAVDIRDHLVQSIDKSADDDVYSTDTNFNDVHVSFKIMKAIAASDNPFTDLANFENRYNEHYPDFSRYIGKILADSTYHYEQRSSLGKFLRNEKLAVQKIVKYAINMLKQRRDRALGATGNDKISKSVKLRVKKAWESFKKGGDIKPLT